MTDAEALHDMLTRAGIAHSESYRDGSIEATDKYHDSIWFNFNADGSLKSIMGSGG